MRQLPAFAIALVSLLAAVAFAPAEGRAQTEDLLHVASNITYNVKTEDGPVRVIWDVAIANNDPETQNSGFGTVFFYEDIRLPVIRGAANLVASDGDGTALDVSIDDLGPGISQGALVDFAGPLFYQETYNFRLTYELPDTRAPSILITPRYAYVPIIAAGDEATVVVNTPAGDPWEVSVEEEECAQEGSTFRCAGDKGAFLAATVEVNDPTATQALSFEVPLEEQTLTVTLTFLQGEDAGAAHQRDLVTASLPLIEQAMGFSYTDAPVLNIKQSGRQSVLGYEGLATCGANVSCEVALSPIADDYTVLHELSHLWSGIFAERWLGEGFAQLTPEQIAPLMPEGLVQGSPPERQNNGVPLQLDDWGNVQSVINADDEQVAEIEAGYDYSLRFLQELESQFGGDALRAVNRNIAGSGESADSQRFMDVLEDATGANLDDLFLIWVFPESYREVLSQRRDALTRLDGLRRRLAEAELPDEGLVSIQNAIRDWQFGEALLSIDALEANVETYAELLGDLRGLGSAAATAGLELPDDINNALLRFDFESARTQLDSANDALIAYHLAGEDVNDSRDFWTDFGLIGSDPDGELENAEDAFAAGEFDASTEWSQTASATIDDASSVAQRRLLIVGGFLSVLLLALGIAFAVTQLRSRELADS